MFSIEIITSAKERGSNLKTILIVTIYKFLPFSNEGVKYKGKNKKVKAIFFKFFTAKIEI